MRRGTRRPVTTALLIAPRDDEPLAATWRHGTEASHAGAFILCVGPLSDPEEATRALRGMAGSSDVVVGLVGGVATCLLLRRDDLPRLALFRNRWQGPIAWNELMVRVRQSGLRVSRIALSGSCRWPPRRRAESLAFAGRRLVERLGWLGFATGTFSRTHRNAELLEFHGSSPVDDPALQCPLCGAGAEFLKRTRLGTTEDLAALGEYHAVLCTRCRVATTVPVPREVERVISADVGERTLYAWQRRTLRRYAAERVRRVRRLLPGDRRPQVVDVGGGACAFANALASAGCSVTVFEPNPANMPFADTAAGVRFVAAPFEVASVAHAGIADSSLDAVTMWHSLEHVPDVAGTLALARRLIRKGGHIYVCVPNIDALQADLGVNRWCYLDIPHHVTHFSPEGLASTLLDAGFTHPMPHWWSEEYEIFGFYQTLLNRLSGSHNYFYNRAKKGRRAHAGVHPLWTRAVTGAGPLLIPLALLLAWWGVAASKPACAELHATVPS